MVRAGDYAGVIELSSRAIKLRRLAEEIAADRAWIAARLERTFTSQEDVENVVREMRGRQQQIEQRQAKLLNLRWLQSLEEPEGSTSHRQPWARDHGQRGQWFG
jgi:hypothetical protein